MENNKTNDFKNFCTKLLKKKSPDDFIETAKKVNLKKTLNAFDLIMLGIGAVIGSGIFTIAGVAMVGEQAGYGAGPAVVISMLIAMFASLFSILCYSEFTSMVPVAGTTYTYTYVTMGEFMAWIVGWILMLEYAIGNVTMASSWTGYFMELLRGFSHIFPSWLQWLCNPPIWLINDYRTAVSVYQNMGLDPAVEIPKLFGVIPFCINVPAIVLLLVITILLVQGIKESTKAATILVFIKLAVIFLFIFAGMFYVTPDNWVPFAPNGMKGILSGAFLIFFAYVGVDAVSSAAEETKDPQKNLPIGLLGTLIACTVVYIATALVLSGMVATENINTHAPIAAAMNSIGLNKVGGIIAVGALAGITSVILVLQLGTARILYAMSRDGFFPKAFQKIHKKHGTPHVVTWVSGILVIFCAIFMDLNISAELCNFGTFTNFMVICIAVLILRKTDPERPRPFKVPFVPWFPILGIMLCGGIMIHGFITLGISSILFPLWILIGVAIYFAYGYKKQRRIENNTGEQE